MKKHFHFIGIGGVGQSALAKILALRGYEVSGSDVQESKYTKELEELNVKINIPHNGDVIQKDWIIVLSSAIKHDNAEYKKAQELNLKMYHRSDILKFISKDYECFIGFSGAHGKTTTTSLAAYILEKINAHPSYASGGIISGLNTNSNSYKDSKIFLAELDESDGTIIKYSPDFIVINNLEADHFDFYKNGLDDVIAQFMVFYKNLKPTSKLILNTDDKGVNLLLNKLENKNNVISYSIKDKTADYYAGEITYNEDSNIFNLYKKGEFLSQIKTKLKGEYNVVNALGVIACLVENNFEINKIKEPLFSFEGAKRRFEKVYEGKVQIVDDYAHHPTEIKSVINLARRVAKNRLVVIFQPHRYTRLKALYEDFKKSFDKADLLFILDTYSAGDDFDTKYNSENFALEINHNSAKYIKGTMEQAAKSIINQIQEGDFILTVGAGDVTKIGRILKDNL